MFGLFFSVYRFNLLFSGLRSPPCGRGCEPFTPGFAASKRIATLKNTHSPLSLCILCFLCGFRVIMPAKNHCIPAGTKMLYSIA
jgi:hypothetical protein